MINNEMHQCLDILSSRDKIDNDVYNSCEKIAKEISPEDVNYALIALLLGFKEGVFNVY
jgi:hypothetical protein